MPDYIPSRKEVLISERQDLLLSLEEKKSHKELEELKEIENKIKEELEKEVKLEKLGFFKKQSRENFENTTISIIVIVYFLQWLLSKITALSSAAVILAPIGLLCSLLNSFCELVLAFDHFLKKGSLRTSGIIASIIRVGLNITSFVFLSSTVLAAFSIMTAIIANPVILGSIAVAVYMTKLIKTTYDYLRAKEYIKFKDKIDPLEARYPKLQTSTKKQRIKNISEKKQNLIEAGLATLGTVFFLISIFVPPFLIFGIPSLVMMGNFLMGMSGLYGGVSSYHSWKEKKTKNMPHLLLELDSLFNKIYELKKFNPLKYNELCSEFKDIKALLNSDNNLKNDLSFIQQRIKILEKNIFSAYKDIKQLDLFFKHDKNYSETISTSQIFYKLKSLNLEGFYAGQTYSNKSISEKPSSECVFQVTHLESSSTKSLQVCSIKYEKNNKVISDLYFDPKKISTATDDQFRHWAKMEVDKMGLSNITLKGNIPKKLAKAIAEYCVIKGYDCIIDITDQSVSPYVGELKRNTNHKNLKKMRLYLESLEKQPKMNSRLSFFSHYFDKPKELIHTDSPKPSSTK